MYVIPLDDLLFIGVQRESWDRQLGEYKMFSELYTLLDHRFCYDYTPTHYIVREFSRDRLLQKLPKNLFSPFKNFPPPKYLLATNVTSTYVSIYLLL